MSKSASHHEELELLEDQNWELSRKTFIRSMLMAGAAVQIPFLNSCGEVENETIKLGKTSPLSENQFLVVRQIQDHLFPEDGNGPGALTVNADRYLLWVLKDPLLNPKEAEYIIKYLDKYRNVCKDTHNKEFTQLSHADQAVFIKAISKEGWGRRWMSRLLTLIFEALLLDPVYGGNPDGVGWKWLNHDPGLPRPNDSNVYPTIMKS